MAGDMEMPEFDLAAGDDPSDEDLFDSLIPAEDIPSVAMHSADELRQMGQTDLVSHATRLQDVLQQLDSEYRILRWELEDNQKSVAFFSRAAKLAHKLNSTDIDTIANVAINELPDYLDCRFAAMYLYDPETKMVELFRSSAPTPVTAPLHRRHDSAHFLVKFIFKQEEPFVAEYIDENTLLIADNEERVDAAIPDEWRDLIGPTCLVFPLRAKVAERSVVLGGLIVGDSPRRLDVTDAEMSLVFSELLSSSLYNAMLVRQLNEMTILDPMTQIFNRRHFLAQLHNAMLASNRYRRPLSIAMLDVDNFKRINDTYGHQCGDAVLREIGELLKTTIRYGVDVPARYGGEEFAVIMPFINVAQAILAGERVRRELGKHVFVCNNQNVALTFSVGVAEFASGETIEKFIGRADAALIRAKKGGRDRVEADDPKILGA